MKTVVKILAGLLAVIVIVVTVAVVTFDPNDYKTQITKAVEKHTGRTLTIDGTISLSVFPWIGVEVGKLSLSNAEGFSKAEFARSDQLDIKVKLLPLLVRDIKIDTISLHGLFVSLETDKQGKTNWQDLMQAKPAEPDQSVESTSRPALAGLWVNGVELVDANIQWLDAQSGVDSKISNLNLKSGAIQFEDWFPLTLDAHVSNNQPKINTDIALETKLKFNQALTALDLKDLVLSVFGIDLEATLAVTELDKAPTAKGSIAIKQFNARTLAQKFDIELPVSANPERFSKLAMTARVEANANNAKLDDIQLRLDDSTLRGYVHVPDLAKQTLRYQLKLDNIDVDSYLPLVVDTPAAVVPAAEAEDVEIALPVEFLRTLEMEGELLIAKLRVKAMDIEDLRVVTKAHAGVVTLAPVSMKLLQGVANAELSLNVKQASRYGLKLDAKNIVPESVINPLLVGLVEGEDIKVHGGLSNLSLQVQSQGKWLSELKRSATGNVRFDASKLDVSGVDIDYFIRNSVATFLTEKKIPVSSSYRGNYTPSEKLAFNTMVMTGVFSDGKLVNDKLTIDSNRIKINGDGVINLIANSIDEKLKVTLVKTQQLTTEDKIIAQPVPVRIHGPFTALKYSVDKSWLSDAVANAAGSKAKAKVTEKVDVEKLKIEEKKQAVEDKLKNKLKGLFNK